MNWTVKTNKGNTVVENVANIDEWIKAQADIHVVARLDAIKTIVVYE